MQITRKTLEKYTPKLEVEMGMVKEDIYGS